MAYSFGMPTYDDRGHGAPSLVLVHGLGVDRTMWKPLGDRLAGRFRVVAMDLLSDALAPPYSIARHADFVAGLVERLALERPVVVGHSRGGLVALDLAARYGQRTGGLVLLESMVVPPDGVLAGLQPMLEGLRGDEHRAFGARLMIHLIGAHMDPADRDTLVARFTSTPRDELVSGLQEMATFDSAAAAARVTCPLLFVATDTVYADLPRLRTLCPQLRTGELLGCGHYFPLACPDQLARLIVRFIETALPR